MTRPTDANRPPKVSRKAAGETAADAPDSAPAADPVPPTAEAAAPAHPTGAAATPAEPGPDTDGTSDARPRMADDPGVTDDWQATPPATTHADEAAEPTTGTEPIPPDTTTDAAADSTAETSAARTAPEPHRDTPDHLDDEPEDHGLGIAGRLLVLLVVAIVAGIGALYAAPRLAPHVPAAVARYLVPGQPDTQARIDALGTSLAAAEARLATLEGALAQRAGQEALMGVADAVAALDARLGALETASADLGAELGRLAAAPAPTPPPAAASAPAAAAPGPDPVLAADLAALASRLDAVEAAAAPATDVAALRADLDALEARVAAAESTRSDEIARLEQAVRGSALDRAVAALTARAASGLPFARELAEAASIAGQDAPAPLAAAAETGVASAADLARSISDPARAALAADIRARADAGLIGQIGAWARSQVVMRPTTAQPGEDVAAILSRIGARLEAGDAIGAEAEAAALPDHARAAMADWLGSLSARAAADAALTAWVATLGANG